MLFIIVNVLTDCFIRHSIQRTMNVSYDVMYFSDTNLCIGVQCQNGGTCVPRPHDFWCECPDRITGRYCQRSKATGFSSIHHMNVTVI